MEKPFIKRVSEKEYSISLIASKYDISPKITGSIRDNNFILSIERYEKTLYNIPRDQWSRYTDQIINLLERLHLIGIYHGDFSEENVVINTSTNEVRLIDFGLSGYIDNIDLSLETSYTEEPCLSISQLLEMEILYARKYLK